MDYPNSLEHRKIYHTTENFANNRGSKEKKEKIFQMPIDLSNKIKSLIDNLELMSSPVVGDYYTKRNKKQNKSIKEIFKKNDHFNKSSFHKKTHLEKDEKFFTNENFKNKILFYNSPNKKFFKTSPNMNKSETYFNETSLDLNKNKSIPIKGLKLRESFYSNNTNYTNNFNKNNNDFSENRIKFKIGQNTILKFNNNLKQNKNMKKLKIITSSSKNFNSYFKDESSNTKDTTKISFNLPNISQTRFTNFHKPIKQNFHHVKFHSSHFQPNINTQNSEFFKLTNVLKDNNPTKQSKSTTRLDKITLNKFKMNYNLFSKENQNETEKQKRNSNSIDFDLNNTRKIQTINFKDKNDLKKFVNTCNEENKISQYTLDVMGKFIKKALPNRLLHKRFSIEQIHEDNMFRLDNFAKNYFIFCEDKDLFISEDYGISEMLNFTKRINGIQPGGSYKFRKIIGDRIGVNVLQEGNHLRLVKLKKPSDVRDLKMNQKFKKQHENIINTLEIMNTRKKNLKDRNKNYVE